MANAEDRPFEYHIFQESNERLRAQKVSTKETDSNVVVRNLSVISTETLTRDQVHDYFQQFGEIELVQWHQINQTHYGFVQFKLEEGAKAVLSRGNHRIGNVGLKVSAADDVLQPDFELILRMLDDVCLKEVLLRLELGDLANAADACVRFKDAANWAFMEKFKFLNFDHIYFYFSVDGPIILDGSVMDEIKENVLRNFGSLACSVGMIESEKMLALVSRYCIDKSNLKELQFEGVHISRSLAQKFGPVFKMLKKLHFRNSTFDENIHDLFPFCTELEDLWVWSGNVSDNAVTVLNSLLVSNLKLKKLSISVPRTVVTTPESFQRYIKAPSGLNLGFDYQYLGKFSMLNELRIDFGYQTVLPVLKNLVENMVPIEHLELSKGVMNTEAFECISQMKQVNVLSLRLIYSPNFNEKHLVEWAKHLQELKELSLDQCSLIADKNLLKIMISHAKRLKYVKTGVKSGTKIELSDYNTVLELVKSRDVRTHLTIKMKGGKVDVPEDILMKNKDWFEIYGGCGLYETMIGFTFQ